LGSVPGWSAPIRGGGRRVVLEREQSIWRRR